MRTSSGPDSHIAYDAPTGMLLIRYRHMHTHGSVEDIEAFAAILLKAARDRRALEASVFPADFLNELVALDI